MKILTNAEELYQTIRIVRNSIPQRSTVPILKSVNLVADEDSVSVAGTDLEVGVRVQTEEVEVNEPGAVAVSADRLTSLLSEFDDEDDLELQSDGNALDVRTTDGEFHIVGHDPDDFPEFPEFEDGPEVKIEGEVLKTMVEKTAFAVADEMQMYALTGLYCRWTPEYVEMVGSDGNRLARFRENLVTGLEDEFVVNVPPRVLKLLARMVEDDDEITFTGDSSKVQYRTERGLVYSRQVEGNYPDYEKAIPAEPEMEVEVDREALASALRKVKVLTPREMPIVKFRFESDVLQLSTRSQEFGEGSASVPVSFDGEPFHIIFNPNYVLDVLKVLADDTIKLKLSGPETGGVLEEGSKYTYVMMPLSEEDIEVDV